MPVGPSFNLGPDTLLCPKHVFTLNAQLSGATAYDWSTGATGNAISITNPGNYWVFVTYNGQWDRRNDSFRPLHAFEMINTATKQPVLKKGTVLVIR